MLYKYSEYINDIEGCPPTYYQNKESTVFRWVHGRIDHPHNFLPIAVIEPRRVNDKMDLQQKCKAYGLSMYSTMANAREQYRYLTARHPQFATKVGEYIAEGKLSQNDGVISSPDKRTGHLTFHESIDIDLITVFVIKGRADGDE